MNVARHNGSLNKSTTLAPKNIEMSTISDRNLTHRMATIKITKIDKPRLQMFTENEGMLKPNNTKSRPLKHQGQTSNLLLKGGPSGNITIAQIDKDPFFSDSRIAFSDSESLRDIDYVFGSNYLTTYQNKGPYKVKSIVPRLPWDLPSLSIARERLDVDYNGNLDHGFFYAYEKYILYMYTCTPDMNVSSFSNRRYSETD